MSEPKRFDCLSDGMWQNSAGDYVLHSDYARLQAEVERLRKAGDAMADEIIGCYNAEGYDPADSETLPKWNAAKEGKPTK